MEIETSPKLIIRRILGSITIELSNRQTWTIGRDESCDIVLQDTWVSRQHASINCAANGDVYFEDLGSRNGSNINGKGILEPRKLQHGDLIVLGTTELEFHAAVLSEPSLPPTTPDTKTVVITQMHAPQRDIWESLLTSQGLAVQVDPSYPDLQDYLTQYLASGQPTPSLLIIDIETYPSNSYAFCRWCRIQHPDLKVLLISGKRTEIFPVERQWAMYQGACDLMPGIPETNLMTTALDTVAKVEKIFKSLDLQPQPNQSIVTTLLNLQEQLQDKVSPSSN